MRDRPTVQVNTIKMTLNLIMSGPEPVIEDPMLGMPSLLFKNYDFRVHYQAAVFRRFVQVTATNRLENASEGDIVRERANRTIKQEVLLV